MIEINVPDNKEKIVFIGEQLRKINEKIEKYNHLEEYKPKELGELTDKVIYYQDKLGEMSKVLFDQRDILKQQYYMEYKHSPALGKKLFLEYNAKLHAPYDKLKEKCWKILGLVEKIITKNELNEDLQ